MDRSGLVSTRHRGADVAAVRTPAPRSARATTTPRSPPPSRISGTPTRWSWSRRRTWSAMRTRSRWCSGAAGTPRDAASRRSDDLLGRLLEQIDPERDAVIVVAPYATGEGTDLTVVGVRAPALEPGLLSSGTTRRPGFVQTVDLAPSILSLVGIEAPSSMEGTSWSGPGPAGSQQDRTSMLIDADRGANSGTARWARHRSCSSWHNWLLWGLAIWTLDVRAAACARSRRSHAGGAHVPAGDLPGRRFPVPRLGERAWWVFVVAGPRRRRPRRSTC